MADKCKICKKPFLRSHRWRRVWHKVLWFRWSHREHRNCTQPDLVPAKRLKGEVPLPFPDGDKLSVR